MRRKISSISKILLPFLGLGGMICAQNRGFESRIAPLTVLLQCKNDKHASRGAAIAFRINPGLDRETYFVTAAHLLRNFENDDCSIRFRGQSDPVPIEILTRRPQTRLDLAAFTAKVGSTGDPARELAAVQSAGLPVAHPLRLTLDAKVHPYGHPGVNQFYYPPVPATIIAIRSGRITFHFEGIKEGFSGGPLLSRNGLLCGIITDTDQTDTVSAIGLQELVETLVDWGLPPQWTTDSPTQVIRPGQQSLPTSATAFFELGERASSYALEDDDDFMDEFAKSPSIDLLDIRERLRELDLEGKKKIVDPSRKRRGEVKSDNKKRIEDLKRLEAQLKPRAEEEWKKENEKSEAKVSFEDWLRLCRAFRTLIDRFLELSFSDDGQTPTGIEAVTASMKISLEEARATLKLAKDAMPDELSGDEIRKLILQHGDSFTKEAFAAGETFGSFTKAEVMCEMNPVLDGLRQIESMGAEIDDMKDGTFRKLSIFSRRFKDRPFGRERLVSLLSRYGLDQYVGRLPTPVCGKKLTPAELQEIAVIRGKLQAAIEERAKGQ